MEKQEQNWYYSLDVTQQTGEEIVLKNEIVKKMAEGRPPKKKFYVK